MSVYLGKNKVDVNVKTTKRSVPSKDVDFYDYDGTRVYSYTASEFAALTEMPANPDHSYDAVPLTSQGWNWSLTDAKAYVADYKMLDIGQTYVPTDGKTHIAISIPNADASRRVMTLVFYQTSSNGVTVDWGDGSATEKQSGTGSKTFTHTYAAGDYDITLDCTAGSYYFSGPAVGSSSTSTALNKLSLIQEIRVGNNCTKFGDGALNNMWKLKYLVLSNAVTAFGESWIRYCYNLQHINVPSSVVLGNSTQRQFTGSYTAKHIVIPKFNSTTFPGFTYSATYCAQRLFFPPNITYISQYAISGNYCTTVIHVPKGVTTLENYAFNDVTAVKEYHFYSTNPPTLSGTSVFQTLASDCIIYVPRSENQTVLNAYKTATNWSTYASHIQEEPE